MERLPNSTPSYKRLSDTSDTSSDSGLVRGSSSSAMSEIAIVVVAERGPRGVVVDGRHGSDVAAARSTLRDVAVVDRHGSIGDS